MENTQNQVKGQVIQAPQQQQVKKEDKNKCCPFLTLPVMVNKQTMVSGKIVAVPEAQLKINLCIRENCALFVNEKCGLLKG